MMTQPIVEDAVTRLHLAAELRQRLSGWALQRYPDEACGLLIGRGVGQRIEVERVSPARNLNVSRSKDRYLLDPKAFLAADKEARASGLDIVGIWHSHPDCPAIPSETDLEAAWAGYSYLIISVAAERVLEWRSWRLNGERFLEEIMEEEEPQT